jgi:hypothetical protein
VSNLKKAIVFGITLLIIFVSLTGCGDYVLSDTSNLNDDILTGANNPMAIEDDDGGDGDGDGDTAMEPIIESDAFLNFTKFLRLLGASGFEFEAPEREPWHVNSDLSVLSRVVFIGDEILTVYEYDSIAAMERDSDFISPCGTSINREPNKPGIEISWDTSPLWVKADFLIVLYVGEDDNIINFLMDNFEHFAGNGYR